MATSFIHPETKKGEIFIGNFDTEVEEVGRNYQTLRFGKKAYYSGMAGVDGTKKPAFVSISEFNEFESADFRSA